MKGKYIGICTADIFEETEGYAVLRKFNISGMRDIGRIINIFELYNKDSTPVE